MSFQEATPEPEGFEYKKVILEFFNKKPDSVFRIDDVVNYISTEHGFAPNREIVSFRISYLIDNAHRLERVPDRRGFYRLKIESPTQGVS